MASVILEGNALQWLCSIELGWHWEKYVKVLTSFSFTSLVCPLSETALANEFHLSEILTSVYYPLTWMTSGEITKLMHSNYSRIFSSKNPPQIFVAENWLWELCLASQGMTCPKSKQLDCQLSDTCNQCSQVRYSTWIILKNYSKNSYE